MIVEYGINPNCSEATIRVDIRGQDKKKVEKLIEKLRLEMTYDDPKPKDWDDEDDKVKEYEMSEGYVEWKNIFGVECLEITGDAPFNFGDDIFAIIKKHLPKAKTEYSEP